MELLAGNPQRRLILGPQPDRWSNNPKSYTFTCSARSPPPYSAKVVRRAFHRDGYQRVFAVRVLLPSRGLPDGVPAGEHGRSIIYAADAARDIGDIAPEAARAGVRAARMWRRRPTIWRKRREKSSRSYRAVEPSDWLLYCLIPTAQLNEPYLGSYYMMVGVCAGCCFFAAAGDQPDGGLHRQAAVHPLPGYRQHQPAQYR